VPHIPARRTSMLMHPGDGGGTMRSRISSDFPGDVSTRNFDLITVVFLYLSILPTFRGCSSRLARALQFEMHNKFY
jgi:hypothetical protein